jgi:hypothetical protein
MFAPNTKVVKDQFKFVTYTSPDDARAGQARTQVRSNAARWHHKHSRARPRNAAHFRDMAPHRDIDAGNVDAKEIVFHVSDPSRPVDVADQLNLPEHTERREVSSAEHDSPRQNIDESNIDATLFTPEACRIASEGSGRSFSQGSMSFRTIALQDSQNIIGMGLNDMQLELSSVMGLYKNICETQAIDFARQYNIGGDQASWGRFYAFVYTDPILLSTAVLLGVRNQLDVLGKCIDGRTFTSVLQIERFLMLRVKDALGDPVRGISDQMLIAVALCAAYEIKHGTGACYHIHMQGLVQMIHLRGGLLAIGSPDPYIVRLLTWIDTNTSKIAGCRPYLQGMVHGLASHPNANTAVFRARGEVLS